MEVVSTIYEPIWSHIIMLRPSDWLQISLSINAFSSFDLLMQRITIVEIIWSLLNLKISTFLFPYIPMNLSMKKTPELNLFPTDSLYFH